MIIPWVTPFKIHLYTHKRPAGEQLGVGDSKKKPYTGCFQAHHREISTHTHRSQEENGQRGNPQWWVRASPMGLATPPQWVGERVHAHTKKGPCLGEMGNAMGCRKGVFCDSTISYYWIRKGESSGRERNKFKWFEKEQELWNTGIRGWKDVSELPHNSHNSHPGCVFVIWDSGLKGSSLQVPETGEGVTQGSWIYALHIHLYIWIWIWIYVYIYL